MSLLKVRVKFIRALSLADVLVLLFVLAGIYALIGMAEALSGPFHPKTEIDLSLFSLIHYSSLSLFRVVIAYVLSVMFAISYGYMAAKSKTAEPILISFLDILQSIPVLGFMPGLVITFVYLFPDSNLGLEIAAVLMIFTGQAWNMVFSFYTSLKTIPNDWKDLAAMLKLNRLQMLRRVELPFAMNGLLWNSMLSVAGGWFFLMVIESFSLGDNDFRLPGIGSYMAVAYERGDSTALIACVIAMFGLIILVDRCVWAPLVVWSERFKIDSKATELPARSLVFDFLKKSDLLAKYFELMERIHKQIEKRRDRNILAKRKKSEPAVQKRQRVWARVLGWLFVAGLVALVVGYGGKSMYQFVSQTSGVTWLVHLKDTFITLIRVGLAVVLGSIWTIPAGVFIGTHPAWTRRLQPVVQVVASFPYPMLYPMVAFAMIGFGIRLEYGAVILMAISAQWYILFNVIAGASLIPQQMLEVADIFRVRGLNYWKAIILPAIFPSLVNGWITAAGGAWNACIVAEWIQSGSRLESVTGIGSSISNAAQAADYSSLACGIITLVVTVVLINRFFWGAMYRMAETRFKLEL